MQVVVLHGPPLAGKGTQADFLAGYGFFHLSAGDYIRDKIDQGDPEFLAVKAVMDAGDLVPDEMIAEIINGVIEQKMQQGFSGVLLDGSPRTLNQARLLDEFLAEKGLPLTVIELTVDDDERLDARRLKRIQDYKDAGRKPRGDDVDEAAFRHRLEVYHQRTAPVTAYYEEKGLLRRIDAFLPLPAIRNALGSILNLAPRPQLPQPGL